MTRSLTSAPIETDCWFVHPLPVRLTKLVSIGICFRSERQTAIDVCGANQGLCKASVADYSTQFDSQNLS
jgi:hypothetical protein